MADITAKMVNDLRNKTGLGMMECKKALTECAGDVEKAIEYFRKKGVKASVTERAAAEGRVAVAVSSDRKHGVIVEVNCNTDFAAKNEKVGELANAAAKKLLDNPSIKLAEDAGIKDQLVSLSQQTGENIQIGRTASLSTTAGTIGSYLYTVAGKGKSAVLISLTAKADDDLFRNVGMHIVAARPIAMTRADVSADL